MKSKKALYNLIASLALQIITSISGIILPRLFIEAYGSNINGMVSSINQFLRYLSLVEAGLGAASIASLYAPLVSKNTNKINEILSASRLFYIKSGYIFALLTIGFSIVYPWLVQEDVGFLTSSVMVIILAGSGLVEYFFVGKYRVLLIADQRSYVISLIQTVGVILNALVAIFFIKMGFSVLVTQSAATLIFVSRVLFIYIYVKSKYPRLNFREKPDLSAIDRRWDAFIQQITVLIISASPVIIITIFCSLSEVSVYVIYSLVFTAMNMILSAFSNGLLGGFGQLVAKGEIKVLQSSFDNYEYIYYMILTWVYTCAAILIIPFVEVYTYNVEDVEYTRPILGILFVVAGVFSNMRIPYLTMINAAGHFRETKYKSMIEAAINLVFSLIFVQFFGIAGVLIGSICSSIFRTPEVVLYTSKHILKSRPSQSLVRIVRAILLGLVSALLFMFFLDIKSINFIQWVSWGMIIGIGVLIIVLLGNLILEYSTFKNIIKRILLVISNLTNRINISRNK